MITARTIAIIVLAFWSFLAPTGERRAAGWTSEELEQLRSLSLNDLGPVPPDPTNRVAGDARAAALGERLFNDTRLSSNGRVACATCHVANRDFQDGIALGEGVGRTARRTMP